MEIWRLRMDDRLVLVDNGNVISYGLRDYSKELEKNPGYKTIKLKDFGWNLIIKRGGEYVKLKSENEILNNDVVCVKKKNKIIVYRGGAEMQIKNDQLNPKTDHVIRPLSKSEIQNNNGKVKIKDKK
jgi:hypothetical protein